MFFSQNNNKSTVTTDEKAIAEILNRGVEDVFVRESLEKRLRSGKQLRIKFGIDPTGPTIHLGRAVVLRKLRAFQDLGHKIVLIVGDFTALIGDPSDKLEKRPMLTEQKIKENLKNYLQVLGKIITIKKTEVTYNSTWLKKLTFKEIAQLAESFSVQQMSGRRNFQERFDKGVEVSLREFMYPLMQGYDSVAVKSDVELGGFDQLFNLKAGRIIQKHYGQPEQDVLTVQMLEGTDGRKMSTSWGNVINITDEANDMFGKVMSVKDELIAKYFLLCTRLAPEEIATIEASIKSGATNPRDAKIRLAKEIVTLYHSAAAAEKAFENFENTFSKGGIPEDIDELMVAAGTLLADACLKSGVVQSKSEYRRLLDEGAIKNMKTDEKVTDPHYTPKEEAVYKIGKRRFLKITVE